MSIGQWIRTLALLPGVLVLLGGCGESSSGSAPGSTAEKAADAGEAPEDTAKTDEPRQATKRVGQSGRDDGLIFKVEGLEEVQSISRGQFSEGPITPPEGAKLIKATVTVRNDGKTAADPFCGGSGAVLLDEKDRNFRTLENQIEIEGNEVCDGGVEPGFKTTYTLAFKMPPAAEIGGLVVWNTEAQDDPGGSQTQLLFVPGSSTASTPTDKAAAALAPLCVKRAEGEKVDQGEIDARARELLTTYEQSDKAASDQDVMEVALANMRDGCAPQLVEDFRRAIG